MTPFIYTQQIADEICERLSRGETLSSIARLPGMPDRRTVNLWRHQPQRYKDFAEAYDIAKDAGFDAIADEVLRIADTPLSGIETTEEPDPEYPGEFRVVEIKRGDMLAHRKLQIETRMKLLAKWDPRRYGERIDPNPPNTPSADAALLTTAQRLCALVREIDGLTDGPSDAPMDAAPTPSDTASVLDQPA